MGLPTPYVMSVDIVTKSSESELSKLSNTSRGQIWIGTARGLGSCTHLGGQWTIHRPAQGEAFVTAVVTGKASDNISDVGQIWLGTNLGPALYDTESQEWTQLALPNSPQNPPILSVLIHDGDVWFGGVSGIWRYSIADKQMHQVSKGLKNPYVNVLLAVDNMLWAGTQGGLAKYDSKQQLWEPVSLGPKSKEQSPPSITALAHREGVLWIGTPQGLGSYMIATEKWNSPKKPYNIRDIVCDKNERLWLATSIGLIEYHLSSGEEVTHLSRPVRKPLLETRISHIKFDGDYIWFSNWRSSRNGGILRFHRPTKTWQRFTRLDIFQSTQKKTMTVLRWTYVDKDAVWFTTDYGVLRYDKAKDIWRHFTMKDGLSVDDLNKIAVSEKSVWVIPMMGMELNRYDKATGTWEVITQPDRREERERLNGLAVDGPEVWFRYWAFSHALQ